MISFDNTEIAFKSKSNKSLKRAYLLFKIIGNPSMVKLGKVATTAALNLRLPIKGLIKKTIFAQFCGGETIADCKSTIDLLGQYGIGTILDYSVEGKTSEEDFDATVKEIISTIETASKSKNIPFAVFKITGISRFSILEKANESIDNLTEKERSEYDSIVARINKICLAAFENQIPVFIDAEETWIQDTIDRITHQMMQTYNRENAIIFNTVQLYRHDRLSFLSNAIDVARKDGYHYGVKLVRGAYMEKERARAKEKGYPSPIQPDKIASDNDFDKALELVVNNIDVVSVCAGSHNEKSSLLLTELVKKNNIEKSDKRIYFAQLLGMSDHISDNLTHAGYNVAKYVPYGPVKEVMPYLLRRADENTSVAGQTSRELSLIMKEKKRRGI
ncbi:MAG: proline dehydrogenase family protein [Flavobacteriia bacterium]